MNKLQIYVSVPLSILFGVSELPKCPEYSQPYNMIPSVCIEAIKNENKHQEHTHEENHNLHMRLPFYPAVAGATLNITSSSF